MRISLSYIETKKKSNQQIEETDYRSTKFKQILHAKSEYK